MQRAVRLMAALTIGLLVFACSDDEPDADDTGDPRVQVALSSDEPGAIAELRVTTSEQGLSGATHAVLEHADDGDWQARWLLTIEGPSEISDDGYSPPAVARELPTVLSFELPAQLDSGEWRLTYPWFEPSPSADEGGSPERHESSTTFEV